MFVDENFRAGPFTKGWPGIGTKKGWVLLWAGHRLSLKGKWKKMATKILGAQSRVENCWRDIWKTHERYSTQPPRWNAHIVGPSVQAMFQAASFQNN